MAAAETRILNQCTYTPIQPPQAPPSQGSTPSGDGSTPGSANGATPRPTQTIGPFTPRRPFYKVALLLSVFDSASRSRILLSDLRANAKTAPTAHEKRLAQAVSKVWAKDMAGALAAIRPVPIETVHSYALAGLKADARLARAAADDASAAVRQLTRVAGSKPPANAAASSATVVVRAALGNASGSNIQAAGKGGAALVVGQPQTGPNRAAPAMPPAPSKLQTVDLSRLQTVLQDTNADSANYLRASGFFATDYPDDLTSGPLLNLIASHYAQRGVIIDNKRSLLTAYLQQAPLEPIGYLHLERLQFTPIGFVRGELVYSLPLTPGETVRLTHREWSRTDTDYATLVATSSETATEDALSEKMELAESSKSEQQHSSAFNASMTASGGFGPVTVTSNVGYDATDAEQESRESAAKHSQEMTRKASSRSKQEHKVSFRVATQYEVEDTSYREITNASIAQVRWDFHRLMQKWRIDLFRYGIRLTYDIVVPEPGSYLLRRHIQLADLEARLAAPNPFNVTPDNITASNYMNLAAQWGASLDPPPPETVTTFGHSEQVYHDPTEGFAFVDLALPDGYYFSQWTANGSTFKYSDGSSAGC